MKHKPVNKDPNRYPKGWNRARVQSVIDHYENQTEDQAAAQDDSLADDLLRTNPSFRELVARSKVSPRRPFKNSE